MINTQMRDLLEQLMQLSEAPVKPGERKEISFKLKKLDKMSSNLEAYKRSLYNMVGSTLPPELQGDLEALQEKLGNEIKKVQAAYDQVYEKSIAASGRPIKMDNVFKAIAKNCKQIVKVYKELNRNSFNRERFMYRGIRSSSDALYGKPFDARKPKDSNEKLHNLVNDTIKNLGFEANRENAMFMTGDRSQASGYGNSLYVMFPVDGFTYTWSREEKDLVLDNSKKMQLIDREVASKIRGIVRLAKEKDSTIPISYPDDLFSSGYDYENDIEKVTSLVERGFVPNEAKKLLDELLTDTSIQTYFKFTNQDLFEAILSNKEIYVRGDYYAVNTNHMKELIDFLKSVDVDSVELPESFGEVLNLIEPGDIVKILSGTYAGRLATVTYTYTDSYEVKLQQDEETTISKDQVELYKLPDGSTPRFADGQKVIVINPDSNVYGDTLVITYMYNSGKLEARDEDGDTHELWISELSDYTPELSKELEGKPKPHKFKNNEYAKVIDSGAPYYNNVGKVTYLYSNGKIELTFPGGIERSYTRKQLEPAAEPKPDVPDTTDSDSEKTFKVQDKVVIVNHPKSNLNGKTGTVDYVYQNYPEVAVIFDDPNLGQEDINVSYVKNVEDSVDTSASEPPIKVGDTIQIINDESMYYGQVGEVIDIGQNEVGKPWVKFKTASNPGGVKTFADWVEKVDKPTEFKIGDTVKVNWKASIYDGKDGIVIADKDDDGDYKIIVAGNSTYVPAQGLKKTKNAPTFNIGDKVKIIDKSSGWYGDIGEIENGPDKDGDYTVIFDEDGEEEWVYFRFDDMEKVEEPKAATKFEVDDIVKITGPSAYNNNSYIGYGGTITSVSDDGKFAGVQLDPDTILTYDTSNLVKGETDEIGNLNWEPEPEVKAPIKVGDTVKNIKAGHPHEGQTGEVKTVYSSGNLGLVYSDGTQAIDPSSYLIKVDAPAQTAAPKFEVNDRVEVVSQFPGLIGMKGKITQVSPNYDFVSVWIDGNTAASSFPTSALKKINDTQESEEIHLGDMVEVINDQLSTYGQKGKVTDSDASMVVIQDSAGEVFFAKKASVKKIG